MPPFWARKENKMSVSQSKSNAENTQARTTEINDLLKSH